MRRSFRVLFLALPVLLLAACAEPLAKQKGLSDADLFERGRTAAEAKKPQKAIEAFQVLIERFPNSPLAARAQFGLAGARAANGEEIEAEAAFDDFLRLYPADNNVAAALFGKGELLYGQTADPGRDQAKTVEALRCYTRFVETAPGDPKAAGARERIRSLRNRLARHEEAVIAHYMARRNYESAAARARRAAADYADTETHPRILSLLAEALEKGKKAAEGAEVRRALKEKYPLFGVKTK